MSESEGSISDEVVPAGAPLVNKKRVIISVILLILSMGLLGFGIFAYINASNNCEDLERTCIIERTDEKCTIRYDDTNYNDCTINAKECLSDESLKYTTCFYNGEDKCPLLNNCMHMPWFVVGMICIPIGLLGTLILGTLLVVELYEKPKIRKGESYYCGLYP